MGGQCGKYLVPSRSYLRTKWMLRKCLQKISKLLEKAQKMVDSVNCIVSYGMTWYGILGYGMVGCDMVC